MPRELPVTRATGRPPPPLELAFIYRDIAENEGRNRFGPGRARTGVPLPGYGGNRTPVGEGSLAEATEVGGPLLLEGDGALGRLLGVGVEGETGHGQRADSPDSLGL